MPFSGFLSSWTLLSLSLTILILWVAGVDAIDHLITVGAESVLAFNPTSIQAAEGDTVTFEFHPKNHSVGQSTFQSPCTEMAGGVTSGFIATDVTATEFSTWALTVDNASQPLWFFCQQTIPVSHCQQGMVFAINPTLVKTFEVFRATAILSGSSKPISATSLSASAVSTLEPISSVKNLSKHVAPSISTTGSSSSTTTGSTPGLTPLDATPESVPEAASTSSTGLPVNMIAGIVAGSIIGFLLAALSFFFLCYRRRQGVGRRWGWHLNTSRARARSLRTSSSRNSGTTEGLAGAPVSYTVAPFDSIPPLSVVSSTRWTDPGSDTGSVSGGGDTVSEKKPVISPEDIPFKTPKSSTPVPESDDLIAENNRLREEVQRLRQQQEINQLREEVIRLRMRELDTKNRPERISMGPDISASETLSRLPSYKTIPS